MPELFGMHTDSGALCAVAGVRLASSGQLFLERYLDEPIEPLISAAAAAIGPGAALTTAKLMAAAFGIALHLNRIHTLVLALTTLYIALAILPWTALFLSI